MHFVVHDYVMFNDELTLQEKCLFSYVEGFHDNQEKTFYASNKHIGRLLNISTRRVSSIISNLQSKGYINVDYSYVDDTKQIKNRFLYINAKRLKLMKDSIERNDVGGIETNDNTLVKEVSTNNKEDILKKKKELFASWWNLYNHKQDRASVEPKFLRLDDETINKIMVHTKDYVDSTHLDGTYPSRRLPMTYINKKTWENEVIKIAVKEKIDLDDYSLSTVGRYIGYCESCGDSTFHDKFSIRQDSPCCSAKLLPKRKGR